MKLSFIYHVNSNWETLEKSINSIFNQTNKNFELIFVYDDPNNNVVNEVLKFKFDKIKNFKFISTNQKIGHSWSFNSGLELAQGDYVYYLGSNVTIDKDFVKNILNLIEKNKGCDFIILNNRENKISTKTFNKVGLDLFSVLTPSIKNKIYNIKFLRKNKIHFELFKYYPLTHLLKCVDCMKQAVWYNNPNLVTFADNKKFSYNLYNIFEQSTYLIENKDNFNFLKNNKDNNNYFEYMIIYSILYSFLYKIHQSYWKPTSYFSSKIIGKALHTSNIWLTKYIPNWRDNPVITNNLFKQIKNLNKYFKDFKFKLIYIHDFFK